MARAISAWSAAAGVRSSRAVRKTVCTGGMTIITPSRFCAGAMKRPMSKLECPAGRTR